MRINGVEKQFRIVEENSKHWPQHKIDEAKRIFEQTATLEKKDEKQK